MKPTFRALVQVLCVILSFSASAIAQQKNTLMVRPTAPRIVPQANVALNIPPNGLVGVPISANIISSARCTFQIDWGDGARWPNLSSGVAVTHRYSHPGTFTVRATGISGCINTTITQVVIKTAATVPAMHMDSCVLRACHPLINNALASIGGLSQTHFQVTLNGQEFGNVSGTVLVNNEPMTVVSWSPTRIVAVYNTRYLFDGTYEVYMRTSQHTQSPSVHLLYKAPRLNLSLGSNRIAVKLCSTAAAYNQCNGQSGGPGQTGEYAHMGYPAIHGSHTDGCWGPLCLNAHVSDCRSTENSKQQDGCQVDVEQQPTGELGYAMQIRVHWKFPPKTKGAYLIDVKVQAQLGYLAQ
jgi:hypothetical protein